MISLEEKISRTERLLRRLEEDEPYLQVRVAALGSEHRQEVHAYAARVRAQAEAELERLLAERGAACDSTLPQSAD
jgi:ribosome-associated translation inhibitor RaiA